MKKFVFVGCLALVAAFIVFNIRDRLLSDTEKLERYCITTAVFWVHTFHSLKTVALKMKSSSKKFEQDLVNAKKEGDLARVERLSLVIEKQQLLPLNEDGGEITKQPFVFSSEVDDKILHVFPNPYEGVGSTEAKIRAYDAVFASSADIERIRKILVSSVPEFLSQCRAIAPAIPEVCLEEVAEADAVDCAKHAGVARMMQGDQSLLAKHNTWLANWMKQGDR
jgi:hypothetical protein